jgi:hypothetical protein
MIRRYCHSLVDLLHQHRPPSSYLLQQQRVLVTVQSLIGRSSFRCTSSSAVRSHRNAVTTALVTRAPERHLSHSFVVNGYTTKGLQQQHQPPQSTATATQFLSTITSRIHVSGINNGSKNIPGTIRGCSSSSIGATIRSSRCRTTVHDTSHPIRSYSQSIVVCNPSYTPKRYGGGNSAAATATTNTNSSKYNSSATMKRSPFVLTNVKGRKQQPKASSYNNYTMETTSITTTPSVASVLAAQVPRVLSRLTFLKLRHSHLLIKQPLKTTYGSNTFLQQPTPILAPLPSSPTSTFDTADTTAIPPLSQLLTNFNHGTSMVGGGTTSTGNNSTARSISMSTNRGTSRLYSSSSSSLSSSHSFSTLVADETDGTTATTTTTTSAELEDTTVDDPKAAIDAFPILLYAVYKKQDFVDIEQTQFTERPITSKALDTVVKQRELEEQQQQQSVNEESGKDENDIITTNKVATDSTMKDTEPPSSSIKDEKDEDDDELVSFAIEADLYSLTTIQVAAEDQFGTSKNLQYYHMGAKEWRSLNTETDLDAFQTFYFECIHIHRTRARMVIPIRIPEYFTEIDVDLEEEELNGPMLSESSNIHTLEAIIEHLLKQLIEAHWVCEDHHHHTVPGLDGSATNTNTASADPNRVLETNPKLPQIHLYRLMKEVTHDSRKGVLNEDEAQFLHEHKDVIPTPPLETVSGNTSSTNDVDTTTTTATAATPTTATVSATTSKDNIFTTTDATPHDIGDAIDESVTVMPTTENPTITKTYMYMKTKDYVLSIASKDASLRGLLFYYPQSLDHIVECLHYKFLWDNYHLKDLHKENQAENGGDVNATEASEGNEEENDEEYDNKDEEEQDGSMDRGSYN